MKPLMLVGSSRRKNAAARCPANPLSRHGLLAMVIGLLVIVWSVAQVAAQDVTDGVLLTTSQTTWKTLAYQLDANNGMVPDSRDDATIVDHVFNTYVLENQYLKVTLLPEYGGRILSIIYKPTGHEELYQNPLGVPYGIGDGNFYYDWLMVYGGIFPTLPEPEHGKAWLLPWDFKVITQTSEEVTVAMSFVDDVAFKGAPGKFNVGTTGIEATFYVTLKAGRAALDTKVVLNNPSDKTVNYEYWLCTTLAPGSQPGDTRATDGAEIIAPVKTIKMPPWWPATTAQEQPTDTQDVYTFDTLRFFKNWADMGIAYAYPDMSSANFWGVVNHDNEEGLIRISDNTVTPGLKLWTWAYNSTEIDPFAQPAKENRPYIEMWAGVSTEFFKHAQFAPNSEIVMEETYSPTVGLSNVTQANRDYLANFYIDDTGTAHLQLFGLQPGQQNQIVFYVDGNQIEIQSVTADSAMATDLTVTLPADVQNISYRIVGADNTAALVGQLSLK